MIEYNDFKRDEWGAITLEKHNYELAAKCLKKGKPFYWNMNLPCQTRYAVLFVPQHNCEGDRWAGCGIEGRFTMVSIERKGCYAFDLSTEKELGYVGGKLNIGLIEAADLCVVFEGIGEFL